MRTCNDCGRTKRLDDLVVLYTREDGKQTWVCHYCQSVRDTAGRGEQAAARAEIDEMLWRDEWEEN